PATPPAFDMMKPRLFYNEATLSKRERRRNARAGVIHVILLSTASVLVIHRLRRLFLVFLLPFVVRHAVDRLARFGIGQLEATLLRRFAIPARQAVAAKAGEIHQI